MPSSGTSSANVAHRFDHTCSPPQSQQLMVKRVSRMRANTRRLHEAVLVLVIVAVMLDKVATDVAALICRDPLLFALAPALLKCAMSAGRNAIRPGKNACQFH